MKDKKWMKLGLWLLVPLVLFTPLLGFLGLVLAPFMAFPWLSGVIGAGFILAWFKWWNIWLVATGISWMLYSAYEYMMYLRIWCADECNIRVDLLLIYPLLIYLSVRAISATRTPKPPEMASSSAADHTRGHQNGHGSRGGGGLAGG